jgi:hypothetical protein
MVLRESKDPSGESPFEFFTKRVERCEIEEKKDSPNIERSFFSVRMRFNQVD